MAGVTRVHDALPGGVGCRGGVRVSIGVRVRVRFRAEDWVQFVLGLVLALG